MAMQLILTLLDELCVPAATPMAAGKSWVFGERSLTVGRVEGNDLVLPVAHISSRHLTIRFRSGRYEATDLGSTNGTMLNGKPLGPPVKVTYRDRLTVGPYTLRVALFLDGGGED